MFNCGVVYDYIKGLSSDFDVLIISDFEDGYTLFHGLLCFVPGELWKYRVKRIHIKDNTLILYVF